MLSPVQLAKLIGTIVDKKQEKLPTTATVVGVDYPTVNIQIGSSPSILKHIKVNGDMSELAVGQLVSIIWEERPGSAGKVPVVQLGGNASAVPTTTVVDRKTIEYGASGLAVKKAGLGMEHLNFTPALANHTHADSLSQHGWKITDDGVLYTGSTFIHPTGQIALGSGSDVVKLDSQDATYRLWAGNTSPSLAPFSVTKAGAIKATSGTIGGWTLSASTLVANVTNVILDAANKAISLVSSTFGNKGIQLQYNGGNPRAYVGDGANAFLKYDGSKLTWKAANSELDASGNLTASNATLSGTITAAAGAIGGWSIGSGQISSDQAILNSSTPYLGLGGATAFGNAGIWFGKDGDGIYKMYIGDGNQQQMYWNGDRLVISGVFVGAIAHQLDNVKLLCHFDNSFAGHLGQVATQYGTPTFSDGKFGKALNPAQDRLHMLHRCGPPTPERSCSGLS